MSGFVIKFKGGPLHGTEQSLLSVPRTVLHQNPDGSTSGAYKNPHIDHDLKVAVFLWKERK